MWYTVGYHCPSVPHCTRLYHFCIYIVGCYIDVCRIDSPTSPVDLGVFFDVESRGEVVFCDTSPEPCQTCYNHVFLYKTYGIDYCSISHDIGPTQNWTLFHVTTSNGATNVSFLCKIENRVGPSISWLQTGHVRLQITRCVHSRSSLELIRTNTNGIQWSVQAKKCHFLL